MRAVQTSAVVAGFCQRWMPGKRHSYWIFSLTSVRLLPAFAFSFLFSFHPVLGYPRMTTGRGIPNLRMFWLEKHCCQMYRETFGTWLKEFTRKSIVCFPSICFCLERFCC
ncbi:hypothetical protein CEXT_499831 [Caerostris extrusa]|uniref:Secreted protein n=1 Tax=Caerostris extrusa TaxID=172846 RepID=A0AAV4MV08_CAEEX|nr:hypothetical protein CEXT_499831 [Caerostris extrusa]